jgi:spermidine/putrescine transport system substrate-binding protein
VVDRRIFLFGLSSALASCTSGRKPRLNVYNWDNYVARGTVGEFEKRYQCEVRYGVYASAEEMLAKVLSGNSGWDVVFPSNSFVQPMRDMDLLLPLDSRKLSNTGNLEPRFRSPEWDPDLTSCIPYMHSSTGIIYSDSAAPAPQSWADLWADRYSGRLTMLDDPAEVFAACLKRLGCSINSASESELRKARDLAVEQKPHLRAYLNEEVRDQVVAGDVLVAQMWAQVAQVAISSNPHLSFAFPTEGFALYADNVSILRESKHRELAYQFLDYLLEARTAAAIASEVHAATANDAARALLPESERNNPILYPSADILRRGEWFRALSVGAQRLRDRYWTEIKSA